MCRLSLARRAAIGLAGGFALAIAPHMPGAAEEPVPGLTGIDRAGEVVQARQLLMSGIEDEMGTLDLAAGGKDLPLEGLKSNAYRISVMMGAFAHLFAPQTKPSADSAVPTAAAPEIWQEFDSFYAQVEAAAAVAYEASQAATLDTLREHAGKLRAACDGCHGRFMRVDAPSPPP